MANYIPQTDYTSRDYESIRRDLINLIPEYAPEWTNRDPADFGITILEAFAYMGDLLNYYIDRAANEAFISTASQRESVLQLARLLSYRPTETTSATVTLTFKNSTASAITVPEKTKVSTTTIISGNATRVVFETDSAVTVPAKVGIVDGSATVRATQGETVTDELIGTSNGQVNQLYQLSDTPVIDGSTIVNVGGIVYTEVPYLIDYQGYDPVYTTLTNANGVTYVVFGDGVSGRIPPNNAQILCTYRVGGGTSGNVAVNTLRFIETNAVPGLTVLNQYISSSDDGAASGGADAESTDSIRVNAPLSIKALNRAVSLSDYASLTLQVTGIAKAISIADVYTSVNVFFAPYGDPGVTIDGVTPSAVFNTLKNSAESYLRDKIPANTTVTFQPPSYANVNISGTITCLPQYKQSTIRTSAESLLNELLDFDNVVFADRISLQDVITILSTIPGVAYTQINKLIRSDEDVLYVITNKVLTSSVATLTTSVTHNLTVGQTVQVSGVDTTFNGIFVVTAVTSNTFSYAVVAANVLTTASGGAATALVTNDIICGVNEIPKIGGINLTLSGGITE
jgi:hypothetical protein